MAKKKPGGRSFYTNKKLGFYLGSKKKNESTEKSGGEVDNQAKGVNMKNSNVSHRTCQ